MVRAVIRAVGSRRGQSLALVLLSALTTACLVSAPIVARAMEQGLLRSTLAHADPADTAVTIRAITRSGEPPVTPTDLRRHLPAGAAPFYPRAIAYSTITTSVPTRPTALPSPVRMFARDDVCAHLRIEAGRCVAADAEIVVSAADARAWGWGPGTVLTVGTGEAAPGVPVAAQSDPPGELTVVGVYTVLADPGYWLRISPTGMSGLPITVGMNLVPGVDDFITSPATFQRGWADDVGVSVQFPLDRQAFTLDSLDRAAAAFSEAPSLVTASMVSPVPRLVAALNAGESRVRFLVPLVAAQVTLLTISVLLLVGQATVEQRRSEVAVARLRGRSRRATGRFVMAELGALVVAGLPLGAALALLVGMLARRLLPAGVPAEVPWLAGVALVVALVASLLTVAAAARPVLREPVAALLQAVRPAVGAIRLRPVDAAVVALATVGVVGLASGTVSGPVAVLTPVLLALAAGRVGAAVVAPTVVRWGSHSLGRVGLPVSLAALGAGRRPALRWLLVAVSMATAMTVFAANAYVIADRNRSDRARLEVGAPTVLVTDATSPALVASATDGLGALARHTAPVAVIRPADATSTATLAIRPADLARVAYPPPGQGALDLAPLQPPSTPTRSVVGQSLSGTLRWTPVAVVGPVAPDVTVQVGIFVTTPDGTQLSTPMGELAAHRAGATRFTAPLPCSSGCRLAGLWVRATIFGPGTVTGTLTMTELAVDGRDLPVADGATWHEGASGNGEQVKVVSTAPGGDVVVDVTNSGSRVTATYADVPETLPVILAGAPPAGQDRDRFEIQNLSGVPMAVDAVQHVPALPEVTDHGALANLDTLARLGGRIRPGGRLEVWVDSEDPATVAAVRAGLDRAGITVSQSRTYSEVKAGYDESATGWGFVLALLGAGVALLIGGLVMVAVGLTAWRRTARDLAALRVCGVPTGVLGRAQRLEHAGVAVLGVLLGVACGLGGGVVAMPLLPLFDLAPPPVPAPNLAPAWTAVVVATALALGVFVGTGLVLARWLVGRAGAERIREAV